MFPSPSSHKRGRDVFGKCCLPPVTFSPPRHETSERPVDELVMQLHAAFSPGTFSPPRHETSQRHVDELVMQLQPHPRAEAHRAAVFRHVCKMVRHVASVDHAGDTGEEYEIQVHRFGSVPLKTYLPHGDLDVTAFAADDKWLQKLKEALEAQARQDDAQFVVSGVYSVPHDLTRPAHAEIVKVVKCQVSIAEKDSPKSCVSLVAPLPFTPGCAWVAKGDGRPRVPTTGLDDLRNPIAASISRL